MEPFLALVSSLHARAVRFVLIDVWGANYYAHSAGPTFTTQDHDLFLPPDPANLLRAWQSAEDLGLELTCSGEPLDSPRDLWLAERIVERRALTRVQGSQRFLVDYSLVMADFDFDSIWNGRRDFVDRRVDIPVASLSHIVQSKAKVGRPKDKLFLETHKEALRDLLRKADRDTEEPPQ